MPDLLLDTELTPGPLVCHDYGDAALLVDIHADSYTQRWEIACDLGRALRGAGLPGLVDVVTTFQNVVLTFDPLITDSSAMRAAVADLSDRPVAILSPRRFDVPAVYGGEHGPDLVDVAHELSMSPEELINLHTSQDWIVRFTGSPVGAPYMDGPVLPRAVARMSEPRVQVAPGSVAMSGLQSSIYPAASPGGWRLIARTPVLLFDIDRDPPTRYAAGDLIRFFPIDVRAWARHAHPLEARR